MTHHPGILVVWASSQVTRHNKGRQQEEEQEERIGKRNSTLCVTKYAYGKGLRSISREEVRTHRAEQSRAGQSRTRMSWTKLACLHVCYWRLVSSFRRPSASYIIPSKTSSVMKLTTSVPTS